MNVETHESQLLKNLAIAITKNPRGTTKDLAEAVGISKATLHRFCGTRENLEQMLVEEFRKSLDYIIEIAEKDFSDYKEGLRELIKVHYESKEFLVFTCGIQSSIENEYWLPYLKAIDVFFLKGQKKGAFRIELGVSVLSELFISILCGLIDAESRGRIASQGVEEIFESFFISGASER